MVVYCPSEPTPSRRYGLSKTGAFPLPPLMSSLVRAGLELGAADDVATGRMDSKRGGGTVGVLTADIVTREIYYEQAVVLAMTRFVRRDVFFKGVGEGRDDVEGARVEGIVEEFKKGKM